ncbi:MAG: flagellar basal body P-ring formation chaperone FlgA [Planctomycetota bacterium]|jgi:flagella basal body P-ring formation protein FlgA
MSGKTVSIVVITSLLASIQFGQASTNDKPSGLQKDSALRIYLPREVTIKDDAIKLGQVSIIRGKESLVTKASEIALGRISVPGQKIVVARSMVLSRLACNGIPALKVTLTGAEKITIRQQHQIIKGNEFVELASSFLKKNPPAASVCQMNPIRMPKDLVLPGMSKEVKLSTRLAKSSVRNQSKVQIAVLADGKEIDVREVTFRLRYNCRRVVALVDIPAGMVISAKNVKIEKSMSNYPEPSDWRPPYGLVARRKLRANTVIRSDMIGPVKPAVIVGRNQTVVIRIERPGLLVTAIGKAMQDGRAGEYIKVRNVDSRRIILAKVREDGSVDPIL